METIKDDEVKLYADFDNRQRVKSIGEKLRATKRLPIIDFSNFTGDSSLEARLRVARALHDACTDTGFFYLANHGISAAELDLAHQWGHVFFELPREEKARCGYTPVGGKNPSANPDKEADQKETYSLARPLLPGETEDHPSRTAGRSQWPDPQLMPGFREFIEAHIVKRIRVAQRLCRALALSLDLPEDYFDPHYRHPGAVLALNYYPPLDPATLKPTQWSFSPHTDYGTFTILLQDDQGGLQVRNASGAWIDVPPRAGTFVVNLGDLFQRWTNDLYVSTLHRAVVFGDRARVSAAFFVSPHGATVVRCLETCQGPGNPPRYEPVESEEYNRALVAQSNRTGRPGVAVETASRLKRT